MKIGVCFDSFIRNAVIGDITAAYHLFDEVFIRCLEHNDCWVFG